MATPRRPGELMRSYTPAQLRLLHPGGRGRPTTPTVITDADRERGERRRRLELLADERAREARLDHFHFGDDDGLPAEELP